MAEQSQAHTPPQPGSPPSVGHAVPIRILATTLVALLVFTWLTVAATWFDLGNWNLWIAMLIATIKATLVALYFMHLRYDRPFNGILLLGTLLFVLLFIGVTLMDTRQYQSELVPPDSADYAPGLPTDLQRLQGE